MIGQISGLGSRRNAVRLIFGLGDALAPASRIDTVEKRLKGKARVLGSRGCAVEVGVCSLVHIQLRERARVLIHLK